MGGPHNAILSRAPKRPLCSSRRKDESFLHPDPALHSPTHTHIQVFKQTKFVLLHSSHLLLLANKNWVNTFIKLFNKINISNVDITQTNKQDSSGFPKNIVKRTIFFLCVK